jgi:osmotically-inducible protein OsmY
MTPVTKRLLAAAWTFLACVAIAGFAQDVGPADAVPGAPGTPGHTLNELRRGIKTGAGRVGQKLGELGREIKNEAGDIKSEVAQRFESVKSDVRTMPVQHQVYSRIHWDRSLHDTTVEVHVLRDGVVLLRGTVPNQAARSHAVELARESVNVTSVIDELTVAASPGTTGSALAPRPGTRR